MSSTEEVKPPYAQQVEDDLNELIEAVGKYRMPSDYQAVGFHAASAGLTAISEGDAVLPEGFQPRLIPAVLITNSGEGLLGDGGSTKLKSSFGTVYAAHAAYGFVGPAAAFILLGAIGIATIAASLIHGQAMAGVGIVGSYVTPALVASQAPNHWALFGFVAVVLVVAAFIARLRDWALMMGAAFAGAGLWTLFYLLFVWPADFALLSFITAVTLAVLEFVWLGRRPAETGFDLPAIVPAIVVAITSLTLLIDPGMSGGLTYGAIFLVAMVAVAVYRAPAIALLHGAGVAAVFAFLRYGFSGTFSFVFLGEDVTLEGFPVVDLAKSEIVRAGIALAVAFLVAGSWSARRYAGAAASTASQWAAWSAAVPIAGLLALWVAFGNLDVDVGYGLAAGALVIIIAAAAEWIARAEEPPLAGGLAVSFELVGAGVALLLALQMGFPAAWTTVLLGAALALPALATRYRSFPVLGWLSVGGAIFVLLRFAIDPAIVGPDGLSTMPFLNWLLPGYGVPALGAAFAAWQLARTTNGRPRLVMEAVAVFFALIGAAMLVRHAMNGGVIYSETLTLAEQSIYTLIALAGSAILIALVSTALGMELLRHHHATCGRMDRRARHGGKVQPRVQGGPPCEGVDAPTERRPQVAGDRQLRRHHHAFDLLVKQARLHDCQQVDTLVGQPVQVGKGCLQFVHAKRPARNQRAAPAWRGADFRGIHAGQARHALAQRLQLHQLGLHLPQLAGHGVQVLAHEAVTLLEFVAHHQPHQGSDDRPSLTRTLEKYPVVQACGHDHQHKGKRDDRKGQPSAAQVNGAASGKPCIRDNEMHRYPLKATPPWIAAITRSRCNRPPRTRRHWQDWRSWRVIRAKGSRRWNC